MSVIALNGMPLPQQLLHWAKTRPDGVALRQKQFGVWSPVTWAQYADQARCFGLGLLQLGLQPGQTVAVLGENCREWVYAELGIALVRGITAGVYPTSPAPEVEYLNVGTHLHHERHIVFHQQDRSALVADAQE